jgi:hypothetical protein
VYEACERRVGTDAVGKLYQKRPAFEKSPSWAGARGTGSTGGRDRADAGSSFDVQPLLATNAADSWATSGAGVARPVCPRPAVGPAVRAGARALSSVWSTDRASPVGSQMATHHEGALASHRQAVAAVELEGDGRALLPITRKRIFLDTRRLAAFCNLPLCAQ